MASECCVAGKHSGRNALRTKLHSLGLDLNQDQLDDVFKRFKVRCTPCSYLSALQQGLVLVTLNSQSFGNSSANQIVRLPGADGMQYVVIVLLHVRGRLPAC